MNIKRSLKNDLDFGLSKEDKIMNHLVDIFGGSIQNTKQLYGNEFCVYDFEKDDGATFELKCRRVAKDKYPTTIIPVHKARNVDTPQYFVFNFIDGKTSYILYNKDVFNTFKKKMITVYRDGSPPIPQNHYEIPIKLLIDI